MSLRTTESPAELLLTAEGTCADDEAATAAGAELRPQLASAVPWFLRSLLRPMIDDASIRVSGGIVHYEAKLPAALVERFAEVLCVDGRCAP